MSDTKHHTVLLRDPKEAYDELFAENAILRNYLKCVESERDAARADAAELRASLRDFNCPRPANVRPDDWTVGQCVDADECGCMTRAAIDAALRSEGK